MKKITGISMIMLLMACLLPLSVNAANMVGDVNGDGEVNIMDVDAVINVILSNQANSNADVNVDGEVNILDVDAIINIILYGSAPTPPETETFSVNGVTFKMIAVEGGTFTMGASDDDPDAYDFEKPAHQVTLSSYSIGETEVTQELWVAVMGSNPSHNKSSLQNPVENIHWSHCQEFITKLNQMTGKQFRLPTEAEWEFAARGGNKSRGYLYAGSNNVDEVAWYRNNSNVMTHAVAGKAPNELGIYDMSGNVYEWCQDWYGAYTGEAQTNPTGPASGTLLISRGGCGSNFGYPKYCRVTYREKNDRAYVTDFLGMRLAL